MGGIATFDKKGSHFQRFGLKIFVIAAKANRSISLILKSLNLSKFTRVHDAVPKQSSMYLPKKIRNVSYVLFEDWWFNITNKQVSLTWR